MPRASGPGRRPPPVPVTVSAKAARLEFQGCGAAYIRDVCHGRCCWVSKDGRDLTTIYVEPDQRLPLTVLGAAFGPDGVLVPRADGRCRFQGPDGLCAVHPQTAPGGEPVKPRSCWVSPWTLTPSGRLVVRNRYKLLRCYRAEPRLPAYRAFRSGLVMLFGEAETVRLTAHFDAGGGDAPALLPAARAALVRAVHGRWTPKGGAADAPQD